MVHLVRTLFYLIQGPLSILMSWLCKPDPARN